MITNNKKPKYGKYAYLLIIPVIFLLIQGFSGNNSSDNAPRKRPLKGGEITIGFGFTGENPVTRKTFTHGGIDIKAPAGTDVVAAASGIVTEAVYKENWGNLVIIRHDDVYETLYAHLKDISVKTGDKVREGEVIGHVGNTGYSTGPHLHYEVRKDGVSVNPEEYIK